MFRCVISHASRWRKNQNRWIRTKNIKKTKEQEIYLTKQKKKKWLLFDNWQVGLNDKTTTDNYSVKVLKGSVITIEGTKLDKKYLDKNIK